jgi:hypothetical protein
MKHHLKTTLIVIIAFGPLFSLISTTMAEVGWVEGTVTDAYTGLPLEGAAVTVNGYSDYTNASGFYRFELFPGTYNITVQMKGYVSSPTVTVYIYANMTTIQDFGLVPFIESSNVTGNPKDTFFTTDEVYVIGHGYSPSTTYHLYVVEDSATWTDGMAIPPRVNGTATTVSSDAGGYIPPTLVWSDPLVIGKYDIVIDVNNNSVYDNGIDYLDDNDIEVTAGFSVIPEYPTFLILPLLMIATLLAVYVKKRKRHTEINP